MISRTIEKKDEVKSGKRLSTVREKERRRKMCKNLQFGAMMSKCAFTDMKCVCVTYAR